MSPEGPELAPLHEDDPVDAVAEAEPPAGGAGPSDPGAPPPGDADHDGEPVAGGAAGAEPAGDHRTEGDPHDANGMGEAPVVPRSIVVLRRTRKALWIAVAVALPVTMLVAVLATRPSAESRSVESPLVGKPAPPAEGTTIDGQAVRLSDMRGKWVLVNFFATWCVPCQREHPELVRFNQAHARAGDAQVLGVVYSDSADAVKGFRADNGGDWPMLTDPDGRVALDFGVAGVPESFLVSPEGTIVYKLLGGVRAVDLERLLDKAASGS